MKAPLVIKYATITDINVILKREAKPINGFAKLSNIIVEAALV